MLLKNTITHHVHFWLKNQADRELFIEGLNTLEAVQAIRYFHIGVPAGTSGNFVDHDYDVSLLVLVDDTATLHAYETDPIHLDFVERYAKPLCAKIVVFDAVNA
jgi:hypothetical protein